MEHWEERRGETERDDTVLDEIERFVAVPRRPTHPRPEAATSLAMVNVISGGITRTELRRTKYGNRGGSTDDRPHLEVVAWVHDVAYDKDVWVDLYLFDQSGDLIRSEMLRLDYQGVAGGDGGLFALNALIPVRASLPLTDLRLAQYRIYYRVNDSVFTDGLLHSHDVPKVDPAPAPDAAKVSADGPAPA